MMLEKILAELKPQLTDNAWENGAIAGGYLRDTILGRPTSDIDIFMQSSYRYSIFKNPQTAAQWKLISNKYASTFKVAEREILGIKVQIISSQYNMATVLKSFSVGLCQVWWRLARTPDISDIKRSPLFQRSVRDHKLYVNVDPALTIGQQYLLFSRLIPKLKKKYDWPIVINHYHGINYVEHT